MFEQLAKQLQSAPGTHQPTYSQVVFTLIAFSLFFSHFVFQQVAHRVDYLAYQSPTVTILEVDNSNLRGISNE